MSNELLESPSRRSLFKGAAGIGLVSLFQAWEARQAHAVGSTSVVVAGPYGPVAPVKDLSTGLELLQLPADFQYRSFAWTGDVMSNGEPCPGSHDGMAVVMERVVAGVGPETVLIRNHERGLGSLIGAPAKYDTAFITSGSSSGYPAGGNTLLVFRGRQWVEVSPALGGTLVNCAGGPTPWGTWLTCEETLTDLRLLGGKKHGYVFEVRANPAETTGNPIVGMGRMSHEAAAVDPATKIVYLTEDRRNLSSLYRYVPANTSGLPGSLEDGGQLQAARVVNTPNADLNVADAGQEYEIEWVNINDPDADPGVFSDATVTGTASGPFLQARSQGCLRMARGEGIWHHAGKMFIVDTATGRDGSNRPGRGDGAVWVLDLGTMRLKALFVSENPLAANNPDNITVSPRGGVVLCEDGGGVNDAFGFGERLLGLTPTGNSYIFCKNNVNLSAGDIAAAGKSVAPGDYRGREFAGACFDPKDNVMFVNMQSPGITYAIWGPWAKGNL
jgi:secreted PhoX family phosphatase